MMNFLFQLFAISLLSSTLLGLNPPLLDELKIMCEKDQQARFALIDAGPAALEEGEKLIEAIDRENLPRLQEIVAQFGWPGFQLVGEEGADKIWLLIQHCDQDLEFQKRCLLLLQEAVAQGDAPKRHLAYLTDRVLVNEGLPQLYGTQIQLINGQPVLRPTENPDQLDERRAEMELEPFTDYLSLIKKVYHLDHPSN